ncbi:MAG TPA: glutamate racemase [Candidatus Angelobacter sp.]|nr:glutamate racemase [Candidatus Angelobacter sp.]
MATAVVFDSGVGGLSVFDCIAAALPGLRLLYIADNAYFPYGTKEEAALVARVRDLLVELTERLHPDLIVVACNTASTVALPALRNALSLPIVGTVPAIKPAAQTSVTRVIGLLGTPGTVRRQYTQALIGEFAPDCIVLRHGSTELVELAEQKLRGESVAPAAVKRALAGLFDQPGGERVDTVVLACTHFPLLAAELAAGAPRPLHWIDSGAAIARRVASLLDVAVASADAPPRHRAIFTARTAAVEKLRPALALRSLEEIEFVDS